MVIELKPETEALIQQDVRRGPYLNVVDFVEHASARRGDLIDEDAVRARTVERNRVWLENQRIRQLA